MKTSIPLRTDSSQKPVMTTF